MSGFLLETKDWNNEGLYIPNINSSNSKYDYFVMVRLKPDLKGVFKKEKIFFSNDIEKDKLINLVTNQDWSYDIPGCFSFKSLLYVIQNKMILPQGALLNGTTKMDAENYYIQSGYLKDISELISLLK